MPLRYFIHCYILSYKPTTGRLGVTWHRCERDMAEGLECLPSALYFFISGVCSNLLQNHICILKRSDLRPLDYGFFWMLIVGHGRFRVCKTLEWSRSIDFYCDFIRGRAGLLDIRFMVKKGSRIPEHWLREEERGLENRRDLFWISMGCIAIFYLFL